MRLSRVNFIIVTVYLVIILVFVPTPFAISQVPDTSKYGVKITYPSNGEMVSVGELTIFGTAKYETTSNACTVYADFGVLVSEYQTVNCERSAAVNNA